MIPLETYWPADYIYVFTLLIIVLCMYRGHRQARINLWEVVTATDKEGKTRTDSRKMFEAGAFTVMTISFAYLVVQDKLTEFYAAIYVGAFVTARIFRDRAQIADRALDVKASEK